MDPQLAEFSETGKNGYEFDDNAFLPNHHQPENLVNTVKFGDDTIYLNSFSDFPPLSPNPDPGYVTWTLGRSSEGDSLHDGDFSDNVLKYISSILMEENIEQKTSMFHDPLALQATEQSLYEVIGEKYQASTNHLPVYFNQNVASSSSEDYLFASSSDQGTDSNSSSDNTVDPKWIVDQGHQNPSRRSHPLGNDANGPMDSSMVSHMVSNIFADSQPILQFKRGVEEARKFLPTSDQLIIDSESYRLHPESMQRASKVVVKVEENEKECSPNVLSGKKNHQREDCNLEEERSRKQWASCEEDEAELSEIFDRILLFGDVKDDHACCDVKEEVESEASMSLRQIGQPHGYFRGKTRGRKQGNKNEAVDLRTLLITCAQSVAADDRRTANELLRQIRLHSSPLGNGVQRLAHVFANGLEARLAGTGSHIYAALAPRSSSAAEMLKAYQFNLSACPFKKMAIFFTGQNILDVAAASTKKKLHIVDFGILYGFQWPILIKYLHTLPGGAPELRITGIELPQPGFRPAELVEETGRRLAKYCERFNVPFQYRAIAQKWETIKLEDLNINSDEVLAVNCLLRFKSLLDETVVVDNSPRDAVLGLIRKMNPDIFIHSVANGSYNAPFFVTRFREALFYYSSMFDICDTNTQRENQERLNYEREFFGRDVMNVIACEGVERVERPETYKLWQVRSMRAGFRILPLSPGLVEKLRGKVMADFHKDFVIDEDGKWMLQGWKGRILCASSCWVPA
ncbi:scarecrow-like protein 33 [Diospyros lotus]|uniref:scarecrow-like protein 33 n=1 Tax=Diospyros lotus TaxID=55363 RepID=UPI00224F7E8C|nr:scarecrow-like protein 33 [Diospyros lotus]XP_052186734.1 scarecrow-like protein 33 [Diospyros lotus]XP_052186735.1 scarecrow-like protein 33 [Diospyros lotus]